MKGMKILKITAAALLVLAVAALAGVGVPETAGGASDDTRDGITVTGEGKATATPDRTSMSFGVQTEGTTAERALAANSAAVRRLLDALKAAGVAAKDLKTEQLDVSPRWDEGKVADERGYQANASVTVSNQPLDRASRLSEIGVKAGADTVSGPGLHVSDPKREYRDALKRAFADARAKAEVLASAAGVSLGEVTAIVEGSQAQPYYAMEMRAKDASAPIEPGTEEITATVTVTFAIR
jgi:uncharacterized protein